LLGGHYLHDARVLSLAQQGERFRVTLQLETPQLDLLTITYTLASSPSVRQEAFAWRPGAAPLWLYDELEGRSGHLVHSVLLSNGWEVTLHFRDVKVEEAQALLPAPRNGVALAAGAGPPAT
jgi:hypothetical protein